MSDTNSGPEPSVSSTRGQPQASSDTPDADPERPAKRRKTLLACDSCRTKKVKCDGVRPVCGACSAKPQSQLTCIYNGTEKQKPSATRKLVDVLQTRIKYLERQRVVSGVTPLVHNGLGNLGKRNVQVADDSSSDHARVAPVQPHETGQKESTRSALSPIGPGLLSSGDLCGDIYPFAPTYGRERHQQVTQRFTETSRNESALLNATSSPGTEPVNAMVGALTGEPQNEGFHGSSSAATFMKQIRRAVDLRIGVTSPDDNSTTDTLQTAAAVSQYRPLADYVLPPRKLADNLCSCYWEYVHPIYPFLHKRVFVDMYDSIWTGQETSASTSKAALHSTRGDERISICILNLVLALSCQWTDAIDPDKRHHTAKTFFARAKEVLKFDALDSSDRSMQLIQALLLMGQYLQITGNAHKAWVIIGTATRICQELGLHLPSNSDENTVDRLVDREISRRVYHGCLMMERMLCMNLGRPVMLSSSIVDSVPLPLEVDDEYLENYDQQGAVSGSQPIQQPSGDPSILSFGVKSATLYKIVERILVSLYLDNSGASSRGYDRYLMGPESVFQIDRELMRWYGTIPSHLKLKTLNVEGDEKDRKDWIFHRQSIVLWARFLQVRIYLFRPIVSQFCTTARGNSFEMLDNHVDDIGGSFVSHIPVDEMLSHRTALQCSIICAKAAMALIGVIYRNLATPAPWGEKPAWLFSVLHVYLSATVLVAVRLQPDIMSQISKVDVELSWRRALDILHRCQSDNQSAIRCVAALEILYERLPKDTPQPQHNENPQRSQMQDQNQDQNQIQIQNLFQHQALKPWPDVIDGTMLQQPYLEDGDPPNYYPSIIEQDLTTMENFELLDLSDMSWFNVFPSIL